MKNNSLLPTQSHGDDKTVGIQCTGKKRHVWHLQNCRMAFLFLCGLNKGAIVCLLVSLKSAHGHLETAKLGVSLQLPDFKSNIETVAYKINTE